MEIVVDKFLCRCIFGETRAIFGKDQDPEVIYLVKKAPSINKAHTNGDFIGCRFFKWI